MEKRCISYFTLTNGESYSDEYAVVTDITHQSFVMRSRYRILPKFVQNIVISFLDGCGAHISISGKISKQRENLGYVEYTCSFSYSVGAEKHLEIHKPKLGAGHPKRGVEA